MSQVTWTGDISYSTCVALKEHLMTNMHSENNNILIIEGMGKLDVAGIQVLLSTHLWLSDSNGGLSLANNPASDRVNALAGRLGIKPFPTGVAKNAD